MDPITLVVTAVALGASAGLKDTATQAVKDAYAGLKTLLTGRAVNVSGVERRPDSDTQRAALTETLTDTDIVDDQVLAAAHAVTEAVAAHEPSTAAAIGVDLQHVRAEFLRIATVDAAGTGVRVCRTGNSPAASTSARSVLASWVAISLSRGRTAHSYRRPVGDGQHTSIAGVRRGERLHSGRRDHR